MRAHQSSSHLLLANVWTNLKTKLEQIGSKMNFIGLLLLALTQQQALIKYQFFRSC